MRRFLCVQMLNADAWYFLELSAAKMGLFSKGPSDHNRHHLGHLVSSFVSISAAVARVCLLFLLFTTLFTLLFPTLALQSYTQRFPRLRQSLSLWAITVCCNSIIDSTGDATFPTHHTFFRSGERVLEVPVVSQILAMSAIATRL